jgi:DNA gyrase/topoisomerase IV subunit A
VKFPLLLAQGVEGIAVGLACKVLPHNFLELIEASIAVLRDEPFTLLPDFPTGGLMDASDYRDGLRGGQACGSRPHRGRCQKKGCCASPRSPSAPPPAR